MLPADADASLRSCASASGPVEARTVLTPRTLAWMALAEPLTVCAVASAGQRTASAPRAISAALGCCRLDRCIMRTSLSKKLRL